MTSNAVFFRYGPAVVTIIGASVLSMAAGCSNDVQTPDGTGGGAAGSSSTGVSEECKAFADAPSPGSIVFHFVNQNAVPIYLPSTCTHPMYNLSIPYPANVDVYYDDCTPTCEELQTSPPGTCSECPKQAFRIEAGGTFDYVWNRTGLLRHVDMPGACYQQSQAFCDQVVQADDPNYSLAGFAQVDCPGCDCDDSGHCHGEPSGMQISTDFVHFDSTKTDHVDVVFPTCSIPCPGD